MDIITTGAGLQFLLRWIHFFAGIAWIGLLYYFNFVQAPFFAETDASTKSNAIQKLVPRALFWFRWAAMFTFLSGALIIGHRLGTGNWNSAYGATILTGAAFGTLMFLNVWLVIWPNQKIVIASTAAVAGGGQADPRAGPAGRRAFLASRTNVVFSLPMLFFMGAASHFPFGVEAGTMTYTLVMAVLMLALELNALTGDKGPTKQPLETVAGSIHTGVILAIVSYVLGRVLL
jgi:uncharacterized membrane protein